MTTSDPKPLLSTDRLYMTRDRLICGKKFCAGMTARYTGFDIDGHQVLPFDAAEAAAYAEWGMTPRCECGTVGWDAQAGQAVRLDA